MSPFAISREIADSVKASSSGGGSYFSPSKIKSGTSVRLHILAEEPTCYFECWGEDKDGKARPFRFPSQPTAQDVEDEMGADYTRRVRDGKPEPLKATMSFPVLNFETGEVQLCSISQKSLIAALDKIANEMVEDYPIWRCKMDISISKEGSGLETRYSLTPLPTRESTVEKVKEAWDVAAKTIDCSKLVAGENPFTKG